MLIEFYYEGSNNGYRKLCHLTGTVVPCIGSKILLAGETVSYRVLEVEIDYQNNYASVIVSAIV